MVLLMFAKCILTQPVDRKIPLRKQAKVVRRRSDRWMAGGAMDLWRDVKVSAGKQKKREKQRTASTHTDTSQSNLRRAVR